MAKVEEEEIKTIPNTNTYKMEFDISKIDFNKLKQEFFKDEKRACT